MVDATHVPSPYRTLTPLDAALAYAARGWAVVPLQTPRFSGCSCGLKTGLCAQLGTPGHEPRKVACSCRKGTACGKDTGKHPRTPNGLTDASRDDVTIRDWWTRWPDANLSLVTGQTSGVIALDIDPYHGGDLTLEDLEAAHGKLPDTVEQQSGGGGRHVLLTHPGRRVPNDAGDKLGVGLDMRGDGGYIVVAPSRHQSGRRYEWKATSGPDDLSLADAPTWLLTRLQAPHTTRNGRPDAGAGQIPDGQRNATLTSLAGSMRRRGMTPKEIYAALAVVNAERCQPPLEDAEVETIAASVGRYAPGTGTGPTAESASSNGTGASTTSAAEAEAKANALLASLSKTRGGEVRETLRNVTLVLQSLHPWATACWYDVVRDLRMVGDQELDDTMVTTAGLAIEARTRMPVRSKHLIPTALTYLCHQRPRDLLREWLDALPPWDHQPRLESWLQTYAHATAGAYSADVSRLLVVSMVARALEPGCQYRPVVILEGPEDTGKTKLVRALATPAWYRELSHGLDGKEAHMRIKRAWVAELAELSSLSKTEESRLKSFFTLNEDAYIPKFSNFEVQHKRRTVFIGTVNPSGDNTYLRGQTGNTRYLPIAVHDINLEGFETVREQLFAEALRYYHDHPTDWWQLSSDGAVVAADIREDRRQRSVYEDGLGAWLERTQKTVTWWEEIASDHLHLDEGRWTRAIQMDVTTALKALGWYKDKRARVSAAGHSISILVVPWRPGPDWRTQP